MEREDASHDSESRTTSSSSTICSIACYSLLLVATGWHGGRQRKGEDGAAVRVGLVIQGAAMEFYRGAADIQTHAHALGLGREEGREQALGHFLGDAVTLVDHRHRHLRGGGVEVGHDVEDAARLWNVLH